MYKARIYIFIYLSIVLSVFLSAGALERYTIPQQQQSGIYKSKSYSVQPKSAVDSSTYTEFENKVKSLLPTEREKLKEYYRKKLKEAVRNRNFDAASHYERLIGILSSN